jgi:hypothetical protein
MTDGPHIVAAAEDGPVVLPCTEIRVEWERVAEAEQLADLEARYGPVVCQAATTRVVFAPAALDGPCDGPDAGAPVPVAVCVNGRDLGTMTDPERFAVSAPAGAEALAARFVPADGVAFVTLDGRREAVPDRVVVGRWEDGDLARWCVAFLAGDTEVTPRG